MNKPKYPQITAILSGANENIFNLTAICYKAMEENGVSKEELNAFFNEITSSKSYDDAKAVLRAWVNVE